MRDNCPPSEQALSRSVHNASAEDETDTPHAVADVLRDIAQGYDNRNSASE
jgi:hypothetical protein